MEGAAGLRAWRWLFLVEGALTVAFAGLNYIMLPDFPENTRSLSPEMRALAELRMTEDYGQKDVDTMSPVQALWAVFSDIKAWVLALSLTAMVVGLAFNQVSFPQHMSESATCLATGCAHPSISPQILLERSHAEAYTFALHLLLSSSLNSLPLCPASLEHNLCFCVRHLGRSLR